MSALVTENGVRLLCEEFLRTVEDNSEENSMSGVSGIGNRIYAELENVSGPRIRGNAPLNATSPPESNAELTEAARRLASAPDSAVRLDKVASIRASIDAGAYVVPASAIAAKIIDSMSSVMESEPE